MSASSHRRPRAMRAFVQTAALLALAALAGTVQAQTPPYQINPFGTATSVTVLEGQTFTPVVRVTDGSGVPVEGWSVDWSVAPSGSIATPTTTSVASPPAGLGGVTSNSFTSFIAGTYTVSASTFDGMVIILGNGGGGRVTPAGTAGPVNFTVTVENVGLFVVDPPGAKDVIFTGATRALQVYWGGATIPKSGTTINWSIVSEPAAGAGSLVGATVTDASGMSTVGFSGAVPGDYTIRAAEFGCTWCGPTSQDFIITVVDPSADLSVSLGDTPDPVAPDGTITYNLSVANAGPQDASALTLTSSVPAGSGFESLLAAPGWSCTTPAGGASGVVTCTLATLASGASSSVSFAVRLTGNPAAGSLVGNTANVTATTADPDPADNDASTDTTVSAAAAMTVAKALSGNTDPDASGSVTVGDTLTYTITAANAGNTALGNVVVGDSLVTPNSATCPSVPQGGQCVLTGTYVVTAADEQAGAITNTGTATATQITGTLSDVLTTPVVLVPAPMMDVNKVFAGNDDEDANGDVTLGDTLHYQVTATNAGNVPLTSVFISDDHFANTQSCPTIAVGATCVLTGTYVVTNADVAAGQVVNTGTATATEIGAPISSQVTTGVVFVPNPAMTLDKTFDGYTDVDGSTTVSEGDILNYTVTATDTGNTPLNNLQIDDAQLTPSFTVCSGISPGGTCVLSGTHVVTQAEAASLQVVNTATATSQQVPGPITSPTVTVPVPPVAAMTLVKSFLGSVDVDASGDVTVGDQLDYDVVATNTGTANLTNVLVSDDHTTATQACATVLPGGTCSLGVSYTVTTADATAGFVTNIGTATSTQVGPLTDSVTTAVTALPPALAIVSGDGQAGYGGQSVTLVVSLFDAQGNPMVGETITWTGAALGTTTVAADGTSSNTVGFNGTTGSVTVTAAYLPASLEVQFTLQSISAALGIVSGNNQTGPAGTTLPDPLVVLSTDDGAPVSTAIVWSVLSGDASVNPVSTGTDGDGLGSTVVTFGPGVGPVQVQAQRTDSGEVAVFTVTAAPAAPAMAVDKVLTGTFDMDGSGDISVGDELYYDVTATNTGTTTLSNVVVSDDHYGGTQACATLAPTTTCVLNVIYTVQTADAIAAEVVNIGSATSTEVPGPVTDTVTTPVAAAAPVLDIVSGDGAAGYGGQSATLTVRLRDAAGNPMPGETITWSGANTGACTTQADGTCSNTVSFNGTTGFFTVTAAYLPASLEVQFTVQSVSAALGVASGNNQTGPAGTTLPDPLVVLATDDGSPVGGIPVQWTVLSGDATVAPGNTVTDDGGLAQTVVTFGPTAGAVQVQAQRTDAGETAVFTVDATAPVRTLAIHDGNNQSGSPGATLPLNLVVEAQDGGVGVDGVVINFTVIGGSDASVGTCCGTTAGGGFAGTSLTLRSSPGPVQVRAERADDPSVFVVFDATAVARGLVYLSGDNQSAPTGTALADLLVVQSQLGGAGEANVTLDWTSTGTDATLTPVDNPTDGSGNGTAQVTCGATAETFNVVAARFDDPSLSVTFTVTCTATRTLTITSGDGATLTVGDVFHGLQVQAQVDGVSETTGVVNWVVTTGNATLTLPASPIDPGGFADTQIESVTAPGPIVVTATHATDPAATATFNLTAVGLPTLAIVSGDNQSGLVGTDADAPLVVVLRDYFGNPIPGAVVNWSSVVNGSVSSPSTLTDANGLAQVTLNYGATPGSITVFVDTPSVPGTLAFRAMALAPGLGIASGDGQVAPANTTLPDPLVVQVGLAALAASRAGGRVGAQALDGVPVTFTVTSGQGAVTTTLVLTDAAGQASTNWTLGPIEGQQTVSASVPGGASITFTATATIARTLVIVSGDGQVAAPGSPLPAPLVVHAQDNNLDAAGIDINWSVVAGSATVTPSGATNASGIADATVQLGATPGAVSIRAERADDPTVFVVFDASTARIQDIPNLTPEERELAIVIDETCATLAGMGSLTPPQQDFLARCQELTGGSTIDPGAVQDALDALMPGAFLAFSEAAFNAAQAQFQNLKARIAALRSGTQGNAFNGLALNGPGGTVSLGSLGAALVQDADEPQATPSGEVGSDFQRWGFFASGTIGRGEAEAGSTRPAYDYDINGLTVGLDYRKSDTFIFGAALGYTRQDTELQGAPGQMDMSGWSVSGYATWYRDNSWYTDAVLTWGRNSFDLLRTITYTVPLPGGGSSSISQTARSQSDGDMLEAAFTFGRDFQAGGWSIGPYGRLLYTKLDFDEIRDEMTTGPGSGLGLSIDARSLTSVASEIGAKFTYAHSTDWGVVTPHLQLEWEHEFKDDPKALTARFLADPNGTPFSLSGEEIDTDYFRMSVGLSIILQRGRSGFVIYERTLSRDGFDQDNLGFGIRIEF